MIYQLFAACGCNMGRIRRNNEDNFYFAGQVMSQDNTGVKGCLSEKRELTGPVCYAVFDGMGGEAYGEVASFHAAQALKTHIEANQNVAEGPRDFLNRVCQEMNQAVFWKSQELLASTMGTTAVLFLFVPDEVYICNLGDSRAYRLRDNALECISTDDVERLPAGTRRKPGITQFLGIDPEEMMIEPHIIKGDLKAGDVYLLCSDGVTDMLTNCEICAYLKGNDSPKKGVEQLIQNALKNGGRDNITALVVHVL